MFKYIVYVYLLGTAKAEELLLPKWFGICPIDPGVTYWDDDDGLRLSEMLQSMWCHKR